MSLAVAHPTVECIFSPSQRWRIQLHTVVATFNAIENALVATTSGAMPLTWVLENGVNLARVVQV